MTSDTMALAKLNFARALRESRAASLPHAGWRWDNYCSQARATISRHRDPKEVIHYVQSANTGFETRSTGDALLQHTRALEDYCETHFPQFAHMIPSFVETPLSTPDTLMALRGRIVSAPLLWHMRIIMAIVTRAQPTCVLEIGGGYGAPGRVWMTNGLHRPDTYITVDFPESLFYAEVYVRTVLPDVDLVYVHRGETLPPARGPRIVLCPIHAIDSVLSAPDLIVNTGSMQEMSDDYVRFYTDCIERSATQQFYSFNNFAQPLTERLETMNLAAPTMSPRWSAVYRKFHPGYRSRAEMHFVRTGDSADALSTAQQAIDAPDPIDGDTFLALFEAVRRAGNSDALLEAAAKAVSGMPYIPKEALWLARAASPTSAVGRVVWNMLEDIAASADVARAEDHSVTGMVEAGSLQEGDRQHPIVAQFAGSVESVMELEGAVAVAGWTGDLNASQPAQSILAAVNGKIVAKTVPVGRRADIEAGYGPGVRPTQFALNVPLSHGGATPPLVQIFATMADGRAVEVDIPMQIPHLFQTSRQQD